MIVLIVLYNPDQQTINRILNLSNRGFDIYIYDNSKISNQKFFNDKIFLNYYHDGLNNGITSALLWISELSLKINNKHFLFFDQDTVVNEKAILNIKRRVSEIELRKYDLIHFTSDKSKNFNAKYIINSGTYFSVELIIELKKKIINYFVDAVDLYICYEAKKNGGKVITEFIDGIDHNIEQGYQFRHLFCFTFKIKRYSRERKEEFYRGSFRLLKIMLLEYNFQDSLLILKFICAFYANSIKCHLIEFFSLNK